MNLYLLMTALYVLLALLMAADASLTSFAILPWFNGLRWLRVHFITLGALTEALFGLLPLLVAIRLKLSRPKTHWGVWLSLNVGLLILLVGIPIVNRTLIFTGGALIFIATLLLIDQLRQMRPTESQHSTADPDTHAHQGRSFYIAGLSYLLLGITVGTGLWLGWSQWLQIQVPIEVHIHANNWGFLSMVFAGLLVDLYPTWAKRPLAWPRSITPIFWMMLVGALGLILGPWIKSNWVLVPGLVLHVAATIWLLLNVIKPLAGNREAWAHPGIWHLTTSYFWILAPVLVAPFIILGVPGFPGVGIEQNAPQALIYGWVFQFGYALLPFLFRWALIPDETAKLGGSWFSLAAINVGGLFLWASIFTRDYQSLLHGTAYSLWALSALPIALDLVRIVRSGLDRLDQQPPAVPATASTAD